MKRNSTVLIMLVITMIIPDCLLSDNTHPYSYQIFEKQTGGELQVAMTDTSASDAISYFIKPNWIEESNVLYIWKGLKRSNAKGNSIAGSRILAGFALDEYLLTILKDNEKIHIALFDSSAQIVSNREIQGDWSAQEILKVKILDKQKRNILFIIDNVLFECSINEKYEITSSPISGDVISAMFIGGDYKLAYLIAREGNGIVRIIDKNGNDKECARMAVTEEVRLIWKAGRLIALVSSKSYFQSWAHFIDPEQGYLKRVSIETSGDRIQLIRIDDNLEILYLKNNGSNYSLISDEYKGSKVVFTSESDIPAGFIEPIGLWVKPEGIIALFRNGIVTFNKLKAIQSVDYIPFGEIFDDKPSLSINENYLFLSSSVSSIILKKVYHPLWFFYQFLRDTGQYLIPIIFFIVIIILYNFYRRKKRLLSAVLNLPSAGAVVVLDQVGRLSDANPLGRTLLGVTAGVPMNKQYQYYLTTESTRPIKELFEESMANRTTLKKKIIIHNDGEEKDWYCTVVPLRTITGQYKGLVLTAIDITEELERKRLSNWAQLAHDMQTNLSTIRLNAEQLEFEEGSENIKRRKKILHQVNLLIQRVRDVVTVGRSDSLNRTKADGEDICREVRAEFDETMFPNVKFELNTTRGNVLCDRTKMVRALRNAVENGIRSLEGKSGKITISNWKDPRFAYFCIKDTGVGMDDKTKAKMLKPYFTTAKKTGGSGMGTMIMKHVIEQHGGNISINSESGGGTELTLSIPIYVRNKKK